MNRRSFITLSSLAGLTPLVGSASAASQNAGAARREVYELKRYHLDTEEQKQGFDTFMRQAAIPALNRAGVKPVGVFYPEQDLSPAYVLLRHRSMEGVATLTQRLLADPEYLRQGAQFLNAPAEKPAYARIESSLLLAFTGMPELQLPVQSPNRVFQLRTYESPSVKTGQKKIEMFNRAELAIFRKTGLHAVFFGEALIGAKMPHLTYMLVFESRAQQKANWKRFVSDPDWKQLRARPEYADKKILCGITNLLIKPAPYSQV